MDQNGGSLSNGADLCAALLREGLGNLRKERQLWNVMED
jgi:hypothetical protein